MCERNVKNEKILETNVKNEKTMCEINVKNEKKFESNVRNQPIFRKKYTQNRGGGSFTGDRGGFRESKNLETNVQNQCENFLHQCGKPM